MGHVQTIRGSGPVTSKSGEQVVVQYELHILQKEFPSLPSISGYVSPVCFFGLDALTLKLDDGRTAKFNYKDAKGNIHVNFLGEV
jgi:hypothetical protein